MSAVGMARGYAHVAVAIDDGLALLTINRPESANAFNTKMAHEIADFFHGIARDPDLVRAVVVTGAGTTAFCAGADLKERNNMTDAQWAEQHVVLERMFDSVLDCEVPVIAAVNGAAYGGGCEFVAICDFAYAARSARFAQREVALAIMPGGGGTQLWPRAIGPKRASEFVLSAAPIDAATALSWGLVNRVVEDSALLAETTMVARTICANGPLAVRQAKKAMRHGRDMDLRNALIFEREVYGSVVASEDRREGIAAFNEKRPPRYRGR